MRVRTREPDAKICHKTEPKVICRTQPNDPVYEPENFLS